MKTKHMVAALASSLTLALAPGFGCSGPDDPSGGGDGTTGTGTTSATGTTGSGTGSGSGSGTTGPDGGTSGGQTTASGSGGTGDVGMDMGGSGSGTGTTGGGTDAGGTTGGGDGGTMDCELNESYFGQIGQMANMQNPHYGGTPKEASKVNLQSAGLQSVVDKIKSISSNSQKDWPTKTETYMENGMQKTREVPKTVALEGPDKITVDGAVVTATSYKGKNFDAGQQNFWLQDADTPIVVYLDEAVKSPTIKVGQRLKFDVTGVKLFRGSEPEITAIENLTVKQGASDAVPYIEATGKKITAAMANKIVRVGGTLATKKSSCPGADHCYTFEHGDKSIEYRVDNLKTAYPEGTCLTFIGPVSTFPGSLADDPNVQLEATNFDWQFTLTP